MDFKQAQQVFQLLSYLLAYPDEKWAEGLRDCREILDHLTDARIAESLKKFVEDAGKAEPDERMKSYVNVFDFGRKTNMYMSYLSEGEQRERGMALLYLKQVYQNAGFQVTDKELPDYLPLILEFSSRADERFVRPIMQKYKRNISEIGSQLTAMQSNYAVLFDVLDCVLEQICVDESPAEGMDSNV
ncbi:MAG: nitrate reductase molybdenum cofactor assembly chaperone [Thermoactinomyces sp.]